MPNFIRAHRYVTRNHVEWELPYEVKPGKFFEIIELPNRCLDEGGLYEVWDPKKVIPMFYRNGRQLEKCFYSGKVRLEKVHKKDGTFVWVPAVAIDAVPFEEETPVVEEEPPAPQIEKIPQPLTPKFKKVGRPKKA